MSLVGAEIGSSSAILAPILNPDLELESDGSEAFFFDSVLTVDFFTAFSVLEPPLELELALELEESELSVLGSATSFTDFVFFFGEIESESELASGEDELGDDRVRLESRCGGRVLFVILPSVSAVFFLVNFLVFLLNSTSLDSSSIRQGQHWLQHRLSLERSVPDSDPEEDEDDDDDGPRTE
jgi:hypothetical protein